MLAISPLMCIGIAAAAETIVTSNSVRQRMDVAICASCARLYWLQSFRALFDGSLQCSRLATI